MIEVKKRRITHKSAIVKGADGQREVQALILKHFPSLETDDCRSAPGRARGEDILLSPVARKLMPWLIEVKRKRKINACRFLEQAYDHRKKHHSNELQPVAFFREDKLKTETHKLQGEWLALISADYLFSLLKSANNY